MSFKELSHNEILSVSGGELSAARLLQVFATSHTLISLALFLSSKEEDEKNGSEADRFAIAATCAMSITLGAAGLYL